MATARLTPSAAERRDFTPSSRVVTLALGKVHWTISLSAID